jgi:hypothetical protein
MTVSSANYIHKTVSETPVDKLKPVQAGSFVIALDKAYTPINTEKLMAHIAKNPTGDKYEVGLRAFQKRFSEAMNDNLDIDGADQKYLADLAHRIALGIIQVTLPKK